DRATEVEVAVGVHRTRLHAGDVDALDEAAVVVGRLAEVHRDVVAPAAVVLPAGGGPGEAVVPQGAGRGGVGPQGRAAGEARGGGGGGARGRSGSPRSAAPRRGPRAPRRRGRAVRGRSHSRPSRPSAPARPRPRARCARGHCSIEARAGTRPLTDFGSTGGSGRTALRLSCDAPEPMIRPRELAEEHSVRPITRAARARLPPAREATVSARDVVSIGLLLTIACTGRGPRVPSAAVTGSVRPPERMAIP